MLGRNSRTTMTNESDTAIWHYLNLAKYVGLLSRGLFFALPSALRLSDPWEGCWGELDFRESLDTTVHAIPDGVTKWQESLEARHASQDQYGVSCWHESTTESAALWQLYAPMGLGVAVKSTPERVQAALGERKVEMRCIDYDGHRGGRRLGNDPLVLLSTKRPEFKHEAEMRFIAALTPDEQTVIRSFYRSVKDHGKYRCVKPGHHGPLVVPGGGFTTRDPTCIDRGAPAGTHLPTDVTKLIDRVYLAPGCSYSLRRAVIDVTASFGFDKKLITEAGFDLAPFDRVKFV